MEVLQFKGRTRRDNIDWLKREYGSVNAGINACIDSTRKNQQADRSTLCEALKLICSGYDLVRTRMNQQEGFEIMQKGIDILCQI